MKDITNRDEKDIVGSDKKLTNALSDHEDVVKHDTSSKQQLKAGPDDQTDSMLQQTNVDEGLKHNTSSAEQPKTKRVDAPSATPGKNSSSRVNKSCSDDDSKEWKPTVSMPQSREPTYYLGGGNGIAMINGFMEELGWKRTVDKSDENFKFRWTELKSGINYGTFKEGEQMVNAIPNCNLLTNKQGLINSLMEYDRLLNTPRNLKASSNKKPVRLNDFVPETYRLDDAREREMFFKTYKAGEMWICKPTGRNQGKGIFIVRTADEIRNLMKEHEPVPGRPSKPLNRIIQRYIRNPLLLDGKKFDLRVYMLIANCQPYLVLFHNGYVRLSIHEYESESDNIIMHLTNQFIQKKDPTYKDVKDETTWSMNRFNDYVNDHIMVFKGIQKDWVFNVLAPKMKEIMTYCFKAVKNKLNTRLGYFGLYGYDFMIDEDMKIYLIEINVNPCLAINCQALRDCVPAVVKEGIYIVIEAFEKSRKGRPMLPLKAMKEYEVIYNEGRHGNMNMTKIKRTSSSSPSQVTTGSNKAPKSGNTRESAEDPPSVKRRTQSISPLRRTRSLSPVKEVRPRKLHDISEKDGGLRRLPRPLQPKATTITPPGSSTTPARKQIQIVNVKEGSPNASKRRQFPSSSSSSSGSSTLPPVNSSHNSGMVGNGSSGGKTKVNPQTNTRDTLSPISRSNHNLVNKGHDATTGDFGENKPLKGKSTDSSKDLSSPTKSTVVNAPSMQQFKSPYSATPSAQLVLLKMTHKQQAGAGNNSGSDEQRGSPPNRGS